MSPDDNQATQTDAPSSGLALGDVLYTLFRHKYLILGSLVLGTIAAVVVRFVKPPNYESTAQIYIPYVIDLKAVNTADPNVPIASTGVGGDVVMGTQVEILRSFDTALDVVDAIGAEKILAHYGGGSNRLGAAGVVAGGISVGNASRTMTLTVTFSHRDPELVQPAMEEVVKAYMRRHSKIHIKASDEVLEQRLGEARTNLATIEANIQTLKADAGVPDLRERQALLSKEYSDLQSELLEDKIKLGSKQALVGEYGTKTDLIGDDVKPESIQTYSDLLGRIDELKRQQRTMLLGDYTTNHPKVVTLEVKLQLLQAQRVELENQIPVLRTFIGAPTRGVVGGHTNSDAFNLQAEIAQVSALERTVQAKTDMLETLRAEAFRLMEIEPKLTELERRRDAAKSDYEFFMNSRQKANLDDNLSGQMVNMRVTQTPTPPSLNMKKMRKLVGAAFGGCVGLGVGLAFVFDMFLDRSIRRPIQVKRALHLPVLLSIPDAQRTNGSLLPRRRVNRNTRLARHQAKANASANHAMAAWTPDNQLQSHIEGLRERVITHFEAHEVEHHPKLVGLTGCDAGAGVSTLAHGLAATLSRMGNRSVLLVDLNDAEGATHSFYRGKPGYGPLESIEADAQATESNGAEAGNAELAITKTLAHQSRADRLADMLPPRFNDLRPKLNADAYDYVVFDMASITPSSVTPRLSGHMDLVLFVIESAKTKDHVAKNAVGLMQESRANVVAVLNKYFNPVPAWLAHD